VSPGRGWLWRAASGGEALKNLVTSLRAEDITLVVARLKSPLRARFDEMELTDVIRADHFLPTTRAAVSSCRDHPTDTDPRRGEST
jgi:hypothetical protein